MKCSFDVRVAVAIRRGVGEILLVLRKPEQQWRLPSAALKHGVAIDRMGQEIVRDTGVRGILRSLIGAFAGEDQIVFLFSALAPQERDYDRVRFHSVGNLPDIHPNERALVACAIRTVHATAPSISFGLL